MNHRPLFSLGVFLLASVAVFGQANKLPAEVHPSVGKAIERSQEAHRSGDHQLAIALMAGTLYPEGITVKLEESNLQNAAERARRATDRAVEAWSRHLNGDSPIRLVRNGDIAAVRIILVPSLAEESEDALGFINLEKSYRWSKRGHEVNVRGTIRVQTHWDGRPLTEDEFTEVICHELGHLLGLADVARPGPLMGPAVKGKAVTEPTSHEARILNDLRSLLRQRWTAAKNLAERSQASE